MRSTQTDARGRQGSRKDKRTKGRKNISPEGWNGTSTEVPQNKRQRVRQGPQKPSRVPNKEAFYGIIKTLDRIQEKRERNPKVQNTPSSLP